MLHGIGVQKISNGAASFTSAFYWGINGQTTFSQGWRCTRRGRSINMSARSTREGRYCVEIVPRHRQTDVVLHNAGWSKMQSLLLGTLFYGSWPPFPFFWWACSSRKCQSSVPLTGYVKPSCLVHVIFLVVDKRSSSLWVAFSVLTPGLMPKNMLRNSLCFRPKSVYLLPSRKRNKNMVWSRGKKHRGSMNCNNTRSLDKPVAQLKLLLWVKSKMKI